MSKYELTPDEARLSFVSLQAKCDRKRRRQKRNSSLSMITAIGAVGMLWAQRTPYFIVTVGLCVAALGNLLLITVDHEVNYKRRQLYNFTPDQIKVVICAVATTEDVRCVGVLTDALNLGVGIELYLLMRTLTRLLPKLTVDDAQLLNTRQRRILIATLEDASDIFNYNRIDFNADDLADLSIKIIQMFSIIGDNGAINSVEKLAVMTSHADEQTRVRDAAIHYLPLIQQRANEENDSHILLRASNTGAPLNQLLRPAAPTTNETDAQQLLRAAATSEETR